MKTSTLKKMAVLLLCIPLFSMNVSAVLPTFGTAKADNVAMYDQVNFLAGPTVNGTGTVSYRIVNIGTKLWADYKITPAVGTTIINASTWAAQLRDFGVDGLGVRKEMNLETRPTTTEACINTALNNAGDPNYYLLRTGEENLVQLQAFVVFGSLAGDIFTSSQLIPYVPSTINNPITDAVAPVMNSAVAAIDGNNITITMSGSDDSNDFFYYIYDSGNNISQVSFTNSFSFPKSVSTLYALNVVAVDYNGNVSNVKTTYVETPFDKTVNLALNKAATAGAPATGNIASRAVDGNTGTFWQADVLANEWLSVNLGSNGFNLTKLQIVWESAYSKKFELYTSMDGTAWTLAKTVDRTLASPNNYVEDIFFPYSAKYVKFVNITRAIPYATNIKEFRAFGMGNYVEVTSPVLTSVLIDPVTIYAGVTAPLVVIAKNQAEGIYTGATLGVTVTTSTGDPTAGVSIVNNGDGTFTATGVTAGSYTLTASATKDGLTVTNTASMMVTDAPRVTVINLSTTWPNNVYAANQPIALTLACVDQYGAAIANPTFVWDIQGVAAGSVTGTYNYTPTAKGTSTVTAKFTNTIGLVQSTTLNFNVITAAPNVALAKTVTAISTATTAAYAIDNNVGNMCVFPDVPASLTHTYDGWVTIDLGAKYAIDMVEVLWEGAYSKTFTVQYSDNGTDFAIKYSVDNNTEPALGATVVNKFSTNPSSARYVKIFSTVGGTGYGVKIREVRVFGALDLGTAAKQIAASTTVIYPNPATDRINITGDVASVAIYSLQGQLVHSVSNVNVVDVSRFAKGIYFVKVTDKQGNQQSSKIEIQ